MPSRRAAPIKAASNSGSKVMTTVFPFFGVRRMMSDQ
jgi:hypothetical protein